MKKLMTLIVLVFSLNAFGATWTWHFWKDNYTCAEMYSPIISCGSFTGNTWSIYSILDVARDPGASGNDYFLYDCSSQSRSYVFDGFVSDSYTVTTSEDASYVCVWVYGPAPNFMNAQLAELSLSGGEYWVDFGPYSMARALSYKPDDFGKWAWDGSINPSYVEPAVTFKTNHGKKHRK